MLSLQEAMQLDFTGGVQDMDAAFGFEFVFDDVHSAMSSGACTPAADEARAGEGEEERRLRRKISNRESARRSRARKQQRTEELERAAQALGGENRALAARLYAAARRLLAVRRGNARLHAEAGALQRRLDEAQRNAVLLLGLSNRLLRTAGHGAARGRAPAVPPQLPATGVASLMT